MTAEQVYGRRAVREALRGPRAVSAEPVDGNDPDLKEAMRLHRLTWSGSP